MKQVNILSNREKLALGYNASHLFRRRNWAHEGRQLHELQREDRPSVRRF